jgi:hypothetical protein
MEGAARTMDDASRAQHDYLTMRWTAGSNTALFRIGQRWLRSVLTNRPKRGARGAMDFSCAAAPAEDKRCFATAVRAAGVGSDCSRERQALRPGSRAPAAAESRVRALAASRRAAQTRGLYLLRGTTRGRRAAARHADHAQTFGPRGRAQSNQALYSGGLPSGAGKPWCYGPIGAAPLRREVIG